MMSGWTIEMFGGLRASRGDAKITYFRTTKNASLLAYLAFYADRSHSREALADRFWPDSDPEAGRHNLRMALTSLRHILEPADVPPGTALLSGRTMVQLNPNTITTDVSIFESLLEQNDPSAFDLYKGQLLQGYYDEWIVPQALR